MKKAIAILVLGLLLISNIAEAAKSKKTRFKTGQVYEGTVIWEGSVSINLPAGKWKMLGKWDWRVNLILANGLTLALLDDNVLKGLVELTHLDSGGKWTSDIGSWLQEVYMVNKTDGCYERSEYTLVKVFKRGMSYNCFLVQHADVNKNLYHPDDPEMKIESAIIRKWIRENNVEVPKIMLCGGGGYFAPVVEDTLFSWDHCIDPEVFGASKNKFTTEDSSEYHPTNINRYPDKKKFMDDWIKLAAQRHKSFEMTVRAKEHHKLDLSKYGTAEVIEKTKTTISSSGLTEELKELHDLYKEGVLTKEEFEKAKKKLLN